ADLERELQQLGWDIKVSATAAPLCWALTSASRSPVEGSGCRTDLDVPSELLQLSFEVCWLVGHFHEPVGGSGWNLSVDDRGRRAFHQFVRSAVSVVGEEDAALWFEAVRQE